MAPQLSEREQVAQVRRVIKKRQRVPAEIVAEAASRTPLIMRFIREKEKRVEAARGASSSVATISASSIIKKNQFVASTRIHNKEEIRATSTSIVLLTNAPFTPGREIKRFPQVKRRKDIYDLLEDDRSVLTTAPVRQAPSARFHKPVTAKALQSEPLTSSFRYPETPSSSQREVDQTLEECLNAVRNTSQVVHKGASKTQTLLLAKGAVTSRSEGSVTAKPQDTLLEAQREELNKFDLEILHLGENNHDVTSAMSPKSFDRPSTFVHQMHHEDFTQFANYADDESDAYSEQPSKKRRRSSRQMPNVEDRNATLQQLITRRRSRSDSKPAQNNVNLSKTYTKLRKLKKKRRLPVNELVTVSERPGNSDIEIAKAQADASQDPISLQADELEPERTGRQSHEPGFRLKIKIRPRSRFGTIDISLFRMPGYRDPVIARNGLTVSSCSDGFEGKEAAPIGLYMPVKYSTRRRESFQKITLKLDKLTLVSEKPSEEHGIGSRHRPKRTRQREKADPTLNAHDDLAGARDHRDHRNPEVERRGSDDGLLDNAMEDDGEDQMLLHCPGGEIAGDNRDPHLSPKNQQPLRTGAEVYTTPSVPSIDVTTGAPEHLVSPLNRKQSAFYDDMSGAENSQREQQSACQRPEKLGNEATIRITHMLAAAAEIKQTSVRARTESLDIATQLKMVSVQKRPSKSKYDTDSSGEDTDSDRESAELEDEEAPEEDDENLGAGEDFDHNEEEDAEGEASQHGDFAAEVVADSVSSENLLQNASPDGDIMTSKSAGALVCSEVDRVEEKGDKFSRLNQKNQDTRGCPLEVYLTRVASQGLLEMDTAELGKQPQSESALLKNNGLEDGDGAFDMLDLDSSWRPHIPDTRGSSMQVDEDIINSPALAPSQGGRTIHRRSSGRRSGFKSRQLTMVRSRQHSPILEDEPGDGCGTQESVELGQEGRNDPRSSSEAGFETQLDNIPEIPETQFAAVPQLDYMERAKIHLSQPFPRQSLSRVKSMPTQVYFAQNDQAGDEIKAGVITQTAAFQHTVSPAKSLSYMSTLLEEGSSVKKSLSSLTRQASLNMGTLPRSARARTPSLPLKPPFLQSTL